MLLFIVNVCMSFIRGRSGRLIPNNKTQTKISPLISHQFGNIVTLRVTTSLQPKTKSNKRVTLPRFCNTLKVTLPLPITPSHNY